MSISSWIADSAGLGVIALLVARGFMPEARAERQGRMICEEWRDYYYNAETGEFLGWVGDAYWLCYSEHEPVTHPANPDSDYDGGWGIPRDPDRPSCEQCADTYMDCTDRVQHGSRRCLDHWQQAHAWCVESKRKKLGRPIEGEYTCLTIEDPAGKPRRDCFGPGINECEESYAQDLPDVTIENTSKINIGQNWWGVGGDERSTVTWGGSRGFIEGCRLASDEAADICFENRDVCYEEAGGCQ